MHYFHVEVSLIEFYNSSFQPEFENKINISFTFHLKLGS